MVKLIFYRDHKGREPVGDWLDELRDAAARARIQVRIRRLQFGNPGDVRPVGGGVMEMRIHLGPGYRLYYAPHGDAIVLLLCAGTKATQRADIRRAQAMWQDWSRRES